MRRAVVSLKNKETKQTPNPPKKLQNKKLK